VASALLNPAGGLRYHLRGHRYAESLWSPFRFALAEWLYAWEPPEKKLVVVGPSGGYCVHPFLYERFDQVLCLEPDPLAKFVFLRRLARAPLDHRPKVRFDARDRLLAEPELLVKLLEAEGDTAVLFTNVLGQLRVLLDATEENDPRLVRIREAVRRATSSRSFASFHDRVSGSLEPLLEGRVDSPERLSDAEVVQHFYSHHEGKDPERVLVNHLTRGFFPEDRPHAYFSWPLLPGVFHLIEATSSRRR
jgi:hypothetical protein